MDMVMEGKKRSSDANQVIQVREAIEKSYSLSHLGLPPLSLKAVGTLERWKKGSNVPTEVQKPGSLPPPPPLNGRAIKRKTFFVVGPPREGGGGKTHLTTKYFFL